MNAPHAPVDVAILAFPETTASVTYGMYDLFMAAGRDWGVVVNRRPGPALVRPCIVAAQAAPFAAANDVPIPPQATLDARSDARIVCVPEITVPPGESLAGRFPGKSWLTRCYANGAAGHGVFRRNAARRGGLLDGHEATTHWAYCDILRSLSGGEGPQGTCPRRLR
jgi:transcriptional regulator GlxA family with amidase domain